METSREGEGGEVLILVQQEIMVAFLVAEVSYCIRQDELRERSLERI